jgi:hypothetical protein
VKCFIQVAEASCTLPPRIYLQDCPSQHRQPKQLAIETLVVQTGCWALDARRIGTTNAPPAPSGLLACDSRATSNAPVHPQDSGTCTPLPERSCSGGRRHMSIPLLSDDLNLPKKPERISLANNNVDPNAVQLQTPCADRSPRSLEWPSVHLRLSGNPNDETGLDSSGDGGGGDVSSLLTIRRER